MISQKTFLDTLLKTPRMLRVKVSPDRKWVVWTWINKDTHGDVYITNLDDSADPIKITDFKQDTFAHSWTADSKSIVVGHDIDGNERVRLYKVDIDTKEVTPLTEENPEYFIRGGRLDPAGKYLVYGANYDFEKEKEIEETVVYRKDLSSNEQLALSHPKKGTYTIPVLNEAGTHILYMRSDEDPRGEQIWLVDIDGNKDKEILNFDPKAKVTASWASDKQVVFVAEEQEYKRVGLYDIETDEMTWLINDSKRNIENASVPYGSTSVVIEEVKNAVSTFTLYSPETQKESLFSEDKNLIPIASLSDEEWISIVQYAKEPGDLVRHKRGSSENMKKITDVFEHVSYSNDDLVSPESYTWKAHDGLVIQGWLYKTTQKPKGTVVLVHGGPTGHSEDIFKIDVQFLVSEGFNVLDPNYRGSTGFSLSFEKSITKEGWGGSEQTDILEGIKSLIKDGIAEEGRVGITGTSYGGYSSWYAITRFPKKYITASAPICGMTDLVVDYETTRPDLRGYTEEMMGGTPGDIPEKFYERSPVNFIKNIEGDLLIVQGANDPNVTPENVAVVEDRLKENNISYEKLVFDDEGHGISQAKNKKVLLSKLSSFFENSFK